MPMQRPDKIPCKYMFSNGTEYELFLETQCFVCKRFRNWHCKTVQAIERARFEGEKVFPFDDLMDYKGYGGKTCKRFTQDPITRQRRIKPLSGQIKLEDTDEQEGIV